MAILERHVQKVPHAAAYWAQEEKWAAVEQRLGGFVPKRYYTLISGSEDIGTVVWEREWESFTALEAAYDKLFSDSEGQLLGESSAEFTGGERVEFYFVK